MTTQIQKTHNLADDVRRQQDAARRANSEPVFFFDGGFHTWGQVQFLAQLNAALGSQGSIQLAR